MEHSNMLFRMKHEEKVAEEKRELDFSMEVEKKRNEEKVLFMKSLSELGVDVTLYPDV